VGEDIFVKALMAFDEFVQRLFQNLGLRHVQRTLQTAWDKHCLAGMPDSVFPGGRRG
jgi:hypothetical protein